MAKVRHPNSSSDDGDKAARRLQEFEDARNSDAPQNDENADANKTKIQPDSQEDEDAGGAPD